LNRVTLIDCGYGNIMSLVNLFERFGISVEVASSVDQIEHAEKILLPGVGSFEHASRALAEKDYISVIRKKVLVEKIPLLGICIGMQLLGESSEEGPGLGLNLIPGKTKKFINSADFEIRQKSTHMGWDELEADENDFTRKNKLNGERFYFAHSYWFEPIHFESVQATYKRGNIAIPAVVKTGNIIGAQFHPEKSGNPGINFLLRFASQDLVGT